MDTKVGRRTRTESSQPVGSRKEGEEKDIVGSYPTTTRSYDPKTIYKSMEGRELSLSPVLYRENRTS